MVLDYFIRHKAVYGFEAGQVKISRFAKNKVSHLVVCKAAEIAKKTVVLDGILSVDHVVTLFHLLKESGYLLRRILEVIIHDNTELTGDMIQPGHNGTMLSEIPRKPQVDNLLGLFLLESLADEMTAVPAVVINQYKLKFIFVGIKINKRITQGFDGHFSIIDRNNY